jgi:hypothetical protein
MAIAHAARHRDFYGEGGSGQAAGCGLIAFASGCVFRL